MMLAHPPDEAIAHFDKLRRKVEAAGRDLKSAGLEVWTSTGGDTAEADCREVIHVVLHNTFGGYHHKRMEGRTMADHVNAMRRYRRRSQICSEA